MSAWHKFHWRDSLDIQAKTVGHMTSSAWGFAYFSANLLLLLLNLISAWHKIIVSTDSCVSESMEKAISVLIR